MQHPEFGAHEPDQRVEPLKRTYQRHQQQVGRVPEPHVHALVEQYFGMLLEIAAAYHYMVHETERRDVGIQHVEHVSVAPLSLVRPYYPENAQHGAERHRKHRDAARRVKRGRENSPVEGSHRLRTSGRGLRQHYGRQQPGHLRQQTADSEKGKQQAYRGPRKQCHAVEAEERGLPHEQQEERVEHREQQRAFQKVGRHFFLFSISAIRAFSSSRFILSSSTNCDTRLE